MPEIRITLARDTATPALRRLAAEYPEEHRRALYRAGSVVERAVKQLLSGSVLRARSNRLRGSVHTEVDGDEARIRPAVVYAAIHELGGVIVPRTAQALVFQTDDGSWHLVKRVVMPARRPFARALEENWQRVVEVFREAVQRVIG